MEKLNSTQGKKTKKIKWEITKNGNTNRDDDDLTMGTENNCNKELIQTRSQEHNPANHGIKNRDQNTNCHSKGNKKQTQRRKQPKQKHNIKPSLN